MCVCHSQWLQRTIEHSNRKNAQLYLCSDIVATDRYIIEWVNQEKRFTQPELGVYTSRKMEEVTFEDLSLRLGVCNVLNND
jgi:hypothetical protein